MHAVALTYFRETARLGSIRRAAAHLNVAASALNRQILRLEQDLGAPLFDRLPGGMRLTAAGDILLRHVTATFHDYDRVRTEIDHLREARSGHLTIAAVDSLLVDFLPRALDRFRADFPAVTYTVMAEPPAQIPDMVAKGEVDVGFTFVGRMPKAVRFAATVSAPIGVIMRADHPLAGLRAIPFKDAAAYPFLTSAGPLPRNADVDPDFSAFKAKLTARLTSNAIQMIKRTIRLGGGIAFFTRLGFLEEIAAGELAWRPFASPAINTLKIGLLVATGRPASPPLTQLIRHLGTELERLAVA